MRSRPVSVPARLAVGAAVAWALAGPARGAEPDVSINEIRGWGGDWVELYNRSGAVVDLSGWRITDCDERGRSRLSRALSFPRGSTLGPHAYLLVVNEKGKKKRRRDREESDTQRVCASRAGTRCFNASWKIDHNGGDVVRLIAPDGRLLSEATYPAGVVAKARSWSRLPNGVGPFSVSEPTPGRDNSPPAP